MNINVVSFGTPVFYNSLKNLKETSLKNGAEKIFIYTREDILKTNFYEKNKSILNMPRGGGYWLWKPYILLETMKKIAEGDCLIYLDAGVSTIANLRPLAEFCKNNGNILLFGNNNKNKFWTKRDAFVLMKADSKKYWESNQVQASFQVYIKNKKTLKFLKEYLRYCKDPRIITDVPNVMGKDNLAGFIENRHDQSILTNLAVKYNIKLFRDPSQGGNAQKLPEFRIKGEWLPYPYEYSKNPDRNSKYGTFFNHHRNVRAIIRLIFYINSKLPKTIRFLTHKIITSLPNEKRKKLLRNKENGSKF